MRRLFTATCLVVLFAGRLAATEPRPVVLDPTCEHDRFVTIPGDIVRQERAFTTSFDSADDNDGDGEGDRWGIPEWVAYQMKRYPGDVPSAFEDRPSPWITDPQGDGRRGADRTRAGNREAVREATRRNATVAVSAGRSRWRSLVGCWTRPRPQRPSRMCPARIGPSCTSAVRILVTGGTRSGR